MLKKELKEFKQTSMGLKDPESKWILNKKGKIELSYNLQLSVDFEIKWY